MYCPIALYPQETGESYKLFADEAMLLHGLIDSFHCNITENMDKSIRKLTADFRRSKGDLSPLSGEKGEKENEKIEMSR
jgi:hypothetical protein